MGVPGLPLAGGLKGGLPRLPPPGGEGGKEHDGEYRAAPDSSNCSAPPVGLSCGPRLRHLLSPYAFRSEVMRRKAVAAFGFSLLGSGLSPPLVAQPAEYKKVYSGDI